ncbi:MAG: hydantoinase/oxoprolinase family protein [Alphaproteobacteria bacterium]|nr:hydantoinase/oxoprolinase family protein [Alphaproteobacteria bacterium]
MSASAASRGPGCRIGIDVGGTFTDFVLADLRTGALTRYKEASVPSDPSLSVKRGLPALLARAGAKPEDVELIVHGTTLLVNAIIQRRGAKVGLVVCEGHRGLLEIGRGRLANTYDLKITKEEPLVPRNLILETKARIRADGSIVTRPEPGEIAAIAARFRAEGVESVTVVLLHAYAHPAMEREVAAELRRHMPDIPVSESAQIWPERREFERSLVAIMNAYVQPIMDSYLTRLTERVASLGISAPIYITASNGGTLSVDTTRDRPIETILSGPASGVVAAMRAAAGHGRIITVDMGGTSADVAVTLGTEPEYTTLTHVGDFPLVLPVVNVSAIGAGGGSIVWVDPQGVLKVGPRSAGADPGPACYGRGGQDATITDCYLAVGLIDPDQFLGGRMRLDRAAAEAALARIAGRAGFTGPDAVLRVAEAALRVATALMSTELYKSLAQRGMDPQGFSLMAFGGAGPTHSTLLAAEARLETVIIPAAPATFCAMGAILADVKRDYVRSEHLELAHGPAALARLKTIFAELAQQGHCWITREGDLLGKPEFVASCDMRYAGQAFDLSVAVPEALRLAPDATELAELFHKAHERTYGFRDPDSAIEITTERVRVVGRIPPIALPAVRRDLAGPPVAAASRRVYHEGRMLDVPVFDRATLGAAQPVVGPAIVEQDDCTSWVAPGWAGALDEIGNLVLRAEHDGAGTTKRDAHEVALA